MPQRCATEGEHLGPNEPTLLNKGTPQLELEVIDRQEQEDAPVLQALHQLGVVLLEVSLPTARVLSISSVSNLRVSFSE